MCYTGDAMAYSSRRRTRAVRLRVRAETILAARGSFEPFLDAFSFAPENLSQKPLGFLFGIFSIDPSQKDAAYIANFLTSTVRKEYYAKPRRSSAESFEAALQRANRALGEIAKEGNLAWLGSLDGALCAVSGTNVHFASCGKGRIFLIRECRLTELHDPEEAQETHPLKTFEDIASGKTLPGDRFVLADRNLETVFSSDALERETRHCAGGDFSQLLKTALVNECDFAGAVIADAEHDTAPSPIRRAEKTKSSQAAVPASFNAFGRDTYAPRKKSPAPESESRTPETPPFEKPSEYVDERGHVYLRQTSDPQPVQTRTEVWMERGREYAHAVVEFSRPILESLSHFFRKNFHKTRKYLHTKLAKRRTSSSKQENIPEPPEPPSSATSEAPKTHTPQGTSKRIAQYAGALWNRTLSIARYFHRKNDHPLPTDKLAPPTKRSSPFSVFARRSIAVYSKLTRRIRVGGYTFLRPFLPRLSGMKRRFLALSYPQKTVVALGLAFILFSPLFFNSDGSSEPGQVLPAETRDDTPDETASDDFWREQWEQEKRVRFVESADTLPAPPAERVETKAAFLSQDALLFAGTHTLSAVSLDSQREETFPLPQNQGAGALVSAGWMNALNLLFFLTENGMLFSWSPIEKEFVSNELPFENAARAEIIGVFSTYLYLWDEETKQISRFPRVPGGFGEPTAWLKEDFAIDRVAAWEVSERIFAATEAEVFAFFQGKRTDFALEETFVPVSITDILASEETLFVLDGENGRIGAFNAETGELLKNIVSESLLEARAIAGANADALFVQSASEGEVLSLPRE